MTGKSKRAICILFAAVMACCSFACGHDKTPLKDDTRQLTDHEYAAASISGTDALDRVIGAGDTAYENRDVGLFYFLWLGAHGNRVYDVSEMEENCPEEIFDPQSKVSPAWSYHFWGKPLYGYYNNADPWVLTRHIEMFTAAGIDFLMFDTSNGPTYDNVVQKLLELLEKFRLQGFAVPKIAFMTNSGTVQTTKSIYDNYYAESAPHRYPELWYKPNGKPLILASKRHFDFDDPAQVELVDFFEMRAAQWPDGITDDAAYPWMEWNYPQPDHNGVRSVSVAQHVSHKMSLKDGNWGRGFSYTEWRNSSDRITSGSNFQGQWETVFEANSNKTDLDDVHSVFVTGWNEWIAIKKYEGGEVFFVDNYNAEYSRDIEPDSGVYGDNYYMQLIENVRKYKYSEAQHYRMPIIDMSSKSAWDNAKSYPDFAGDAIERNYKGYDPRTVYTDTTNRNDIVNVKVATDKKHVYFRIECSEPITEYRDGDTGYMNVWINPDDSQGYLYVINREYGKLSKRGKDGTYAAVSDVQIQKDGKVMTVTVKLSEIGVDASDPGFNFKVSDNVDASNPMNFYIQGDSAPIGRLSYTYGYIK